MLLHLSLQRYGCPGGTFTNERRNMMIPNLSHRNLALAGANVLLCAAFVLPVAASPASDAQARYRQDMATCNSGQSSQDPDTCRLEARNALADARRGGLNDAPGTYTSNALQRCSGLPGNDRNDCESRVRGEGRSEGSVDGGGIMRETTTVVPAK
jgi:hypothetical protein